MNHWHRDNQSLSVGTRPTLGKPSYPRAIAFAVFCVAVAFCLFPFLFNIELEGLFGLGWWMAAMLGFNALLFVNLGPRPKFFLADASGIEWIQLVTPKVFAKTHIESTLVKWQDVLGIGTKYAMDEVSEKTIILSYVSPSGNPTEINIGRLWGGTTKDAEELVAQLLEMARQAGSQVKV